MADNTINSKLFEFHTANLVLVAATLEAGGIKQGKAAERIRMELQGLYESQGMTPTQAAQRAGIEVKER